MLPGVSATERVLASGEEEMKPSVQPASTAEITGQLEASWEPGCFYELRAFGKKTFLDRDGVAVESESTFSGYFNDPALLAAAAAKLNVPRRGGYGACEVYSTVNPVPEALASRAYNRVVGKPKSTTRDEEIERIKAFFVDVDTDLPAGVPATDEHHEVVVERAGKMREYLTTEFNYPAPNTMSSGNGIYLKFRTDLPNDAETANLLKSALQALAARFNEKGVVKIDTGVFNASRLMRVPGTVNHKGDDTFARPHRVAGMIEAPSPWVRLSREQLEQLASQAQPGLSAKGEADTQRSSTADRFEASPEFEETLRELWKQKGITAVDPEPYENAYMRLLSACPFNSGHNGTSVAVFDYPDHRGFKCHHRECEKKQWKHVRKLLGLAVLAKSGTAANGRQSQISALVDIGMGSELYHTPEGIPYARQAVDGHHEDWPTNSKAFRESLARAFHAQTGTGPGSQAVRDAIATLDGYARFEGDEHAVHVRVAGDDEHIWLDLGNQDREVVEITAAGWNVVADPLVRFRRPAGMLPLPKPAKGGSWSDIKSFLNVTANADWSLILSWCVTALRPEKPYPILYLLGEQGSAKSTATRVIRSLIDPFKAPLRTMPRDERDLFIAASNCRVLAFDNVSKLPSWLSDALCRLATGGGLATRALYTDCDEVLFEAMRPIIMNGIEQAAIGGDFLERAIMLELPTIVKANRRDEAGFWTQFKKSRPKTLGVVLDGVSAALKGVGSVNLESKPRMADFAIFSTAAEAGLGFDEGTFQKAYEGNRDVAVDEALEAMPISPYVLELANAAGPWTGTFSELLEKLGSMCGEEKRPKYWPETPRKLSADMKRIAPALRERGIGCTVSGPGHQSRREITLSRTCVNTSPTSPTSPTQPQAPENNQHGAGDVGGDIGGDVSTTAHTSSPTSPAQVSENIRRGDDGDVGDVVMQHLSGGFEIIEEF